MGCVCRYRDLPLYCVIGINTQTHMCGILKSLSLPIGLCEHTSCRCVLKCKMVFARDVSCNTNRLTMGFGFQTCFKKKKNSTNEYSPQKYSPQEKKKKDFALPFQIPLRCKWRHVQISNLVHCGLSGLSISLKMSRQSI